MLHNMRNKPKILLFSPINEVKSYVIFEWLSIARSLNYDNYDILLIDNSQKNDLSKELESLGLLVESVNPKNKTHYQFIAESQEIARKQAIKSNYDYIFSFECDIIPPSLNILNDLLEAEKPLIGSCYNIHTGKNRRMLLNVPAEPKYNGFNISDVTICDKDAMVFCDGTVKQVFNAGLGATLIHKSVFHKIPFRHEPNTDAHSDTWFATDCYNHGIDFFIHTGVICKHKNQNWELHK